MKLLLKQRFLSFLDSYDVFDESGDVVFHVSSDFSFGRCMHIHSSSGEEVGAIKQRVWTFMPKFDWTLPKQGKMTLSRSLSFHPVYELSPLGYQAEGDFPAWNYQIKDKEGILIASMSKEVWNLTDTYAIHVEDPSKAILALMFALSVDAEKASQNSAYMS